VSLGVSVGRIDGLLVETIEPAGEAGNDVEGTDCPFTIRTSQNISIAKRSILEEIIDRILRFRATRLAQPYVVSDLKETPTRDAKEEQSSPPSAIDNCNGSNGLAGSDGSPIDGSNLHESKCSPSSNISATARQLSTLGCRSFSIVMLNN
jgi:hypothetical protein